MADYYRIPPPPPPPPPGLIKRILNEFVSWFGTPSSQRAAEGNGGQSSQSTQTGSQVESPASMEAQVIQLRYDRDAIMADVRDLMDSDPRMAQSNEDIGRDVFGAGLHVTVRPAEGTPEATAKRAQDIVDAFLRDTDLNGHGPGWVMGLLEDGDLYLSPVVQGDRAIRVQALPTATMDRMEDTQGRFIDTTRAFRQLDRLTREEIATFALWQVNHIRWIYRPTRGIPYGRSQYLQVRGLGRYLHMEENDLVVMRRTRAPLRRVHTVGTPDAPGQDPEITTYRQRNGLDNPDLQQVTTDYISNGKTTVESLDGQRNLGEIDDVKHIENAFVGRMGKPKGLMGWGEDINRDVLEQQEEMYRDFLRGVRNLLWNGDGGVYSGIRALIDFALLLAGINPDQVTYQASWPIKLTKAQLEFVAKIDERRASGFISHRTALSLVADTLGLESAEAELMVLGEERAERQKREADSDEQFAAGQTGAASRKLPEDDDDDEGVMP